MLSLVGVTVLYITIILLTIYLLIAYLRQVSNDITIYFVPNDVIYSTTFVIIYDYLTLSLKYSISSFKSSIDFSH